MGKNGLSEDQIPEGWYCYERIGDMDKFGHIPIKTCPYWVSTEDGQNAYCMYEDVSDSILLWDQVKICDVKNWYVDEEV